MNCGSTASMKTIALGLLKFTRKPRSTRVSGRPMGRSVEPSARSLGSAFHCLTAR
ncbi:hypothetical protein D9M68_897790 [compost metagenome]